MAATSVVAPVAAVIGARDLLGDAIKRAQQQDQDQDAANGQFNFAIIVLFIKCDSCLIIVPRLCLQVLSDKFALPWHVPCISQ